MAARRLGRSIIECGRGKSSQLGRRERAKGARRWRIVEGDYVPGPRKGEFAELRDNLKPLRRWLEAQVGRPWSVVYSEFSAREDRRSLRGDHIHRHLKEMVGGSGGQEYCHYPSAWMPLCRLVGLHGWDAFFLNAGILDRHARIEDCWAWSNARGYFKKPPKPVKPWVDTRPPKPVVYIRPRDPMEVLKERKLERNRARRLNVPSLAEARS